MLKAGVKFYDLDNSEAGSLEILHAATFSITSRASSEVYIKKLKNVLCKLAHQLLVVLMVIL